MKSITRMLILAVLILLSAGVYWNTLSNDFVAGDRQFILRNKHIGDFKSVMASFTSDYWGKLGGESFMYYRPLVILTHYIDFKLHALNPAGHHFSNVILHSMVTLAVYYLFLNLLPGMYLPAFAGASLFALHPIHTHSVTYVMGRTDVLATLFFIWGFIVLINISHQDGNRTRIHSIMGACICYFLALLCKEIAVTLPLIFLAYTFCFDRTKSFWKKRRFLIPLFWLACTLGIYLGLRITAVEMNSAQIIPPGWYSVPQRMGLVIHTLGFYLQKMLLPLQLCYYSNMVVPASWQETVFSPFFVTFMVWLITFSVSFRYWRTLSFSLVWITITLLPVLNIILLPALAKENYLYLPSIGFCLIFAVLISEMVKHAHLRVTTHLRIAYGLYALIALFYAGATIDRNRDYLTPLSFMESTLRQMSPVDRQQREDKRYFEAVKNIYTTYKNLGILYQHNGLPEKAINAYRAALEYTPSYFSPYYAASVQLSLGTLLKKIGCTEEAVNMHQARSAVEHTAW